MSMRSVSPPVRRSGPGLPVLAIVGLALLAVPRAVLHDLDVVPGRTFVNLLLAVVPILVWVAVAVARRVPNPFLTLLVVGLVYGFFLALTHQLLWDVAFGDDPPAFGGNLRDVDPGVQEVVMRVYATISSMFTGVIVGAVSGLLAWGLGRLTAGRS